MTTNQAETGLFGDDDTQVQAGEKLSADRRRTLRQKDNIVMGLHPLTKLRLYAPDDPTVTCGTCTHLEHTDHHNRGYLKCAKYGDTRGAASDARRWWPGCALWQPSTPTEGPQR